MQVMNSLWDMLHLRGPEIVDGHSAWTMSRIDLDSVDATGLWPMVLVQAVIIPPNCLLIASTFIPPFHTEDRTIFQQIFSGFPL